MEDSDDLLAELFRQGWNFTFSQEKVRASMERQQVTEIKSGRSVVCHVEPLDPFLAIAQLKSSNGDSSLRPFLQFASAICWV